MFPTEGWARGALEYRQRSKAHFGDTGFDDTVFDETVFGYVSVGGIVFNRTMFADTVFRVFAYRGRSQF